jgi:nitrite reductase/ring-hydroxylating ferredoxin subunit
MIKWYEQRYAPPAGTFLCQAREIDTGTVKEFRFGSESPFAFRLFIYNDAGKFKAFRNACPHFNVPLNHTTKQLNALDSQHFVCMTHFARFEKGTGLCVSGPCEGQSLESIPLRQEGEFLLIDDLME